VTDSQPSPGAAPRPLLNPLPPLAKPVWTEVLVLAPVLASAFVAFFRPIWDPDTFWHLAVGRQMAWTGRWVDTETFSFTAGGQPWEDTEWLFHGFLFPLQRLGGDPFLIIFTALAGILALLQMYRLVRLAGGGALAFSLATLAILPAVADRIRCRPDLVTFLFMGVLAEVLWRNLPDRPGVLSGQSLARGHNTRPAPFLEPGPALKDLALMLALLFGVWANLHGGWAFGAALLTAFLAGSLLDRWAARDLRWRDLGRCVLVGLAALLALFLTPYTWRIPWFPIKHVIAMADSSLVPIEEWNRTP